MGKNTMGPSNSSEDTKESMEHLKVSLSHVEMVVTPYHICEWYWAFNLEIQQYSQINEFKFDSSIVFA